MARGRPKRLKLDQIRLDGNTQARVGINDAVVADYAELMERGVKFPAITVFHDGTDYWLGEGFHRVHGARRAGLGEIAVAIRTGTRDEAAWFAAGANQDHGLRRTNDDKAKAVKMALTLRPRQSNSAIAKHCGVSDHTVARVRDELETILANARTETRTDVHGVERPAHRPPPPPRPPAERPPASEHGPALPPPPPPRAVSLPIPPPPPPRDIVPPAPPPLPAAAEADSDEPDDEPARDGLDCRGTEIPTPEIRDMFRRRAEIAELHRQLTRVRKAVMDAIEAGDHLFDFLTPAAFQSEINNVRRMLRFAMPYAVCPYCGGVRGCRACRGQGWVNRTVYHMAPEENRR